MAGFLGVGEELRAPIAFEVGRRVLHLRARPTINRRRYACMLPVHEVGSSL